MGRSVYVPRNAEYTVYLYLDDPEPDDDGFEPEYEYVWECFIDNLKDALCERFPSLAEPDRPAWFDSEGLEILRNGHVSIVVSRYYNVVSVSPVLRHGGYWESGDSLSKNWARRCESSFREALNRFFDVLRRLGTASNGETFWERA